MSDLSTNSTAIAQKMADPYGAGRRCDFCGDVVKAVRRVALDVEYDRLQKIHQEQYSCSNCFEAKEQKRLGLDRR